ncbi:MAG: hypothetical protein ABL890_01400 [Candidatus Peribacteraceae bacterium]
MKIQRSIASLVVASVAVIVTGTQHAHAYLTPEAVFGSDGSTTVETGTNTSHAAAASSSVGFDRTDPEYLPPNSRAADYEKALQESQRDFQYADIEEIEVHAAAPAEDTSPARDLLDDETQYQLRQERLLEQQKNVNGNVTIVIGGEGEVVTANGTVLKSAAPRVTATGPTTVLMSILLVLAAVSTVVYARIRERQTA